MRLILVEESSLPHTCADNTPVWRIRYGATLALRWHTLIFQVLIIVAKEAATPLLRCCCLLVLSPLLRDTPYAMRACYFRHDDFTLCRLRYMLITLPLIFATS